MTLKNYLLGLACAVGLGSGAWADQPVKIGLILPMSGPFATYGKQIEHGVDLYLAANGDTLGGRKVEVILKDDSPGTSGDVDKRLAQQLVVQNHVDILAGFAMTPSAFAVAPIATEAKIPMIVMNAATSSITTKSPYIVRVSMTLPQNAAVIASWAAQNKINKVFILVAEYGPGFDAESQFKKTFTAAGGTIVGDEQVPLTNPDYGPYLQKIENAKPDAVFLFLPPGAGTIAFVKGFNDQGLGAAGVKLISTGDLTGENILGALGAPAEGLITAFHYSEAHNSPENAAFTRAFYKSYPSDRPDSMSVAGYDGMQLIDKVLQKTHGSTDATAFINAAEGLSWTSPRGPVSIDPQTRDIVQSIYIRKVEMLDGKLQNIEISEVPDFKDPGKVVGTPQAIVLQPIPGTARISQQ